jgi:hypothetical protein
MDIEDLFRETNEEDEEEKEHPMIIPEFDPCSREDGETG